MISDDVRCELHDLLRPWLRVLRERTFLTGTHDVEKLTSGDCLWLRLPAKREVDARVFEALELLALVGTVDYALWRRALSEATAGRTTRRAKPGLQACQVGCVLSISGTDEFPNVVIEWCERAVVGALRSTASREYTHMRDWLDGLHERAVGVSSSRRKLEIPLEIWVHEESFERRMRQLAAVAVQQRNRHKQPLFNGVDWTPLFRVTKIDPGTPDVLTARAFKAIVDVVSCGIAIDTFKPNGMEVTSDNTSGVAEGLTQLMGFSQLKDGELSMRGVVRNVELPVYMTPKTVAALFGALRTSKSVRSLAINSPLSPWQPDPEDGPKMTQEERVHFWRWIAFSIFGPYADNRIKQVGIDVSSVSQGDLEGAQYQVANPHSIPGFQYDAGRVVSLTPNTRPVRYLKIERVNRTSRYALPSLLHSIGAHIETLSLQSIDCDEPLDDFIRNVSTVCPRLRRLCISYGAKINSMQPIVDAYERSTWQLQSLELVNVEVVDKCSLADFFDTLASDSRAISGHLRRISFKASRVDALYPGLLASLEAVLRSNFTLHELDISISYGQRVRLHAQDWSLINQVASHNGEPISLRRGPLDISQKLAFLSIESHRMRSDSRTIQSDYSQDAHLALPSALVATIFEFAAKCERRSVSVRFTDYTAAKSIVWE